MQSYIIAGGSVNDRANYLRGLSTAPTELIHLVAEKNSLTIKQIQALNTPLSVLARLPRLVWIEEANQLTLPAQNALLKMLEEPPSDTTFYLTCRSKNALLPTILSRCQTITLANQSPSSIDHLSSLKGIMSLSPGDRLAGLVKRDRSESLIWITQIEQALRNKLKAPGLASQNYALLAKIARQTQAAHLQFASNCSVGLTTQVFLLSLPKTK